MRRKLIVKTRRVKTVPPLAKPCAIGWAGLMDLAFEKLMKKQQAAAAMLPTSATEGAPAR